MSHINYKNERLHFNNICVSTLTNKIKTPFYLYSEDILRANYLEFFQEAQHAGLNNPLVCFAMKSNPNRALVKILSALGSGADIVSIGEMKRALEAGIPGEKIVFSGVGKTEQEISEAFKLCPKGIQSFNIESIEELEMINMIAKKHKKIARICFRLNPVVKPKTHRFISTGNKTHKFGILKEDIFKSLKSKKLWTNAKVVGLSVHIGSQLLDLKATKKAIQTLCEVALECKQDIEFLDVGGGLGVDYHPDETKKLPKIKDYMDMVASQIEKHFHAKSPLRPRIVFEPGRRIIAKSGIFVMSVIRTKISDENRFMIVDGGMNDFMRPSLYEAYHHLSPLKKTKSNLVPTNVVGPICETSDCFASNRLMPDLKPKERLALLDAGAYGYSMGSNYNLRGRPAEYLLTTKKALKLINKEQNYQSLS